MPSSASSSLVHGNCRAERGFFAPGHCSWLPTDAGEDYLLLHARFGSPQAKRQMCLARLRWTEDGRPVAEPAS